MEQHKKVKLHFDKKISSYLSVKSTRDTPVFLLHMK